MRGDACGHGYEKAAITALKETAFRRGRPLRCPVVGCQREVDYVYTLEEVDDCTDGLIGTMDLGTD